MLKVVVKPGGGLAVRVTVPVKPATLETVRVDAKLPPSLGPEYVSIDPAAEMLKSKNVTVTWCVG